MEKRTVVIVGAYGYTGRLICHELKQHGIDFSIAGRDRQKLEALQAELQLERPGVVADIQDPEGVNNVVESADMIVNCVGPFYLWSTPLLTACIDSRKIYMDITGELAFVRHIRKKLHRHAQETGSTIICSCAFESLLVDLISLVYLDEDRSYVSIDTYYEFSDPVSSGGTKLTSAVSHAQETKIFRSGRFETAQLPLHRENLNLPGVTEETVAISCPYPEVQFLADHFKVADVQSWLLVRKDQAAWLGHRPKPVDIDALVKRHNHKAYRMPTEAQRLSHLFCIRLVAEDQSQQRTALEVSGRDPYGLTALLVCMMTAEHMVLAPMPLVGVQSPALLVDRKRFLETLRRDDRFKVAIRRTL